jgi:hypothetical protein
MNVPTVTTGAPGAANAMLEVASYLRLTLVVLQALSNRRAAKENAIAFVKVVSVLLIQ